MAEVVEYCECGILSVCLGGVSDVFWCVLVCFSVSGGS